LETSVTLGRWGMGYRAWGREGGEVGRWGGGEVGGNYAHYPITSSSQASTLSTFNS